MRTMRNLSLRFKVMSVVVLILIAFTIVGITVFRGMARERDAVADAREARAMQALTQEIVRTTTAARQGVDTMVRDLTLEPAKPVERALKRGIRATTALGKQDLGADIADRVERVRKNLKIVRKHYTDAKSTIAKLGVTENKGFRGKMRTAVHAIENSVNKRLDKAIGRKKGYLRRLKVKMLMLRRHEKDFIIRGDKKELDAIGKRAEEFRSIVAKSPLLNNTKSKLTSRLATYVNSVKAFADGKISLAKTRDQMNHRFNRVMSAVNSLNKSMGTRVSDQLNVITRVSERIATNVPVIGGVTLALLIAATLALGNAVARPITALTLAIERLADRDWDTAVPYTGRGDEVGRIADAVAVLREKGREADKLQEEQAEAERRAREERRQSRRDLADRFETEVQRIVEQVGDAAQRLQDSAQHMTGAADATREQVQAVSSSAEQASSNVETVASAAQELSNSIDEVGKRITAASQTARTAREHADGARQQVQSLAQAADQIGDVIQQIQDIAEKTNLLALNATIEAARAGEAGKGFAVVADEVKSLANQTQKATEDISQRINRVQAETNEAVSAIETVAGSMREIDEAASSIASAVEQQVSSTNEISRNVEEASSGVQAVADSMARMQQTADQAGSASSDVLTAATNLDQQARTLNSQVDAFLRELREA